MGGEGARLPPLLVVCLARDSAGELDPASDAESPEPEALEKLVCTSCCRRGEGC
jgi:hypothetical protein